MSDRLLRVQSLRVDALISVQPLKPVLTHVYPLAKCPQAHDSRLRIRKKGTLSCLLPAPQIRLVNLTQSRGMFTAV